MRGDAEASDEDTVKPIRLLCLMVLHMLPCYKFVGGGSRIELGNVVCGVVVYVSVMEVTMEDLIKEYIGLRCVCSGILSVSSSRRGF